ncbi:MAG: guanylate kinase [Bacilli bacterium]|nr:guanylate kinase [Bacilli bacterium]
MSKKNNFVVIISGPSGVGKGTIRKKLINIKELNLGFSVSYTTRKIRKNEIPGVDYYFVDRKSFENAIRNNEFLEYAEFVGNYYGTSKRVVDDLLSKEKNVLLEIEIEGFKQVMKKSDGIDILSFFIMTPNLDELKSRIRKRSSEDEKTVKNRLFRAKEEIKYKNNFNYIIVNNNLDDSVNKIAHIIQEYIASRN